MLLSVYMFALQPQGAPAAQPQPGVKQELFRPQGGPGLQMRHDRLVVAPAQQQQQAGAQQREQQQAVKAENGGGA